MNKTIGIVIGVTLVLLIAGGLLWRSREVNTETSTSDTATTTTARDSDDTNTSDPQLTDEGSSSGEQSVGYKGEVIAGSTTPFLVFNQADYDKAVAEGKVVFLDFYANWCPICRAEAPDIHAAFNELSSDEVVGFRVNYNDSDTDSDEEKLADAYGITYQYTKVIVKDGKVVTKSQDVWSKEDVLKNINAAI
jgi:thiol-disulfide isomerase/thioredoxin